MVAKHLCTTWNELVDSAVASLEGQGDGSAVWAGRMKRRARPVALCVSTLADLGMLASNRFRSTMSGCAVRIRRHTALHPSNG